jgi:hypothetical protein
MRDETNTKEPRMQDKTFINLLSEVIDQATANLVENDWVLSEQKKELAIDALYDKIAEEHRDGMVLVNEHAWAEVW